MAQGPEFMAIPKPAPNLKLPRSSSTVKVSIIDSTSTLTVPLETFMGPSIPGHASLQAPAFSFLVTHTVDSTSTSILFDLGCRPDWRNLAPEVVKLLTQPGWDVQVEKDVATILQEHGIDVAGGAIDSIIWSHWHYDHVGDPSTFPSSTTLVVGPGFKEAFIPAYPSNPGGVVLESDFAGRELLEINFTDAGLQIGGFHAFDYFGDGSFYLLDAPGHAIGHLCGLARVSTEANGTGEEDTFIFMGADICHHGGEFRPTEYLPLPHMIGPSPLNTYRDAGFCPGAVFENLHHKHSVTEPFYQIKEGVPHNLKQAKQMVGYLEEFDAADNVFVVIAHDASLLESEVGMTWFPEGDMKGWKKQDLARKARWGFLRSYEEAVAAKERG